MHLFKYNFGCYEMSGYIEAPNRRVAIQRFIDDHEPNFEVGNEDHIEALEEVFKTVDWL